MRVGFLATLPPTKGISDYTRSFLASTPKHIQFECYVISQLAPTSLYPGGDQADDSKYHTDLPDNILLHGTLNYYNLSKWVRTGLTTTTHLFHIHWWTPFLVVHYFILMCILRARRISVVLTVHNVSAHENRVLHWIATKILLGLSNHVIVHTSSGRKNLARKFRYDESQITVLPHGLLAPPVDRSSESKESARRLLGLPQSRPLILFFGNIRGYKGLNTLLEAMKSIVKTDNEIALVVAGMPWKGNDPIKRMVRDFNLENHVVLRLQFIHHNRLPLYFESTDLVVLPYTHFDAQTGVGLYSIHFEKPLIVTRVGGLPDLVLDDSVIIPPKSPQALAETILRVLKNPALMAKLAEDSRILKRIFDWKIIAEQTGKVYENLLRGH